MNNKMTLWQKFKNGLFTKTQVLTGVTISMLVSSALVWAFSITSLNVFTSGQTISSSEVNDNFTYVKERLDNLAGDKFTVTVSNSLSFPTHFSNDVTAYGVIDFDIVNSDFSVSGIGTDFITQDFVVLDESRFYEYSIIGSVDTGNGNNGYIHVAKKIPGSANFSSMGNLYLGIADTVTKGIRGTEFLNSGSTIQLRGGANRFSGNGPATLDVKAGLIFSLKKL